MNEENNISKTLLTMLIYLGSPFVLGIIYPFILGIGLSLASLLYFSLFPLIIGVTSYFTREKSNFIHQDVNGNRVISKKYARLAKPFSIIFFIITSLITGIFWSELFWRIFIINLITGIGIGYLVHYLFYKGYFETQSFF
ncbi:hypothetical protein [Aureivirga sp. CE67]|uniref:hypothetical protein n=1 Tax=Aureivirga sp. CE67 TaxID=1788983 RepID=UPI0018CBF07F|nr:hypothetical protein [Aureivirga sp. CE67]